MGSTAAAPPLHVRRAHECDALDVLRWRNDLHTRAMSRDGAVVSEDRHVNWFGRTIHDPRRVMLIGEIGARKIGMVRFDQDDAGWEVSINIAPEHRGQGHGAPLLSLALAAFTSERGDVPVLAVIKPENAGSVRLFEAAGFIPTGAEEGYLRYAWRRPG